MLDIGIFAPFGGDHERNRAFCRDTAVRHIVLSVSDASSGEGPPAAADLARLAGEYAAEGVTLAALTPPRVPQQAFADAGTRERELESIGRLLESMGTAGRALCALLPQRRPPLRRWRARRPVAGGWSSTTAAWPSAPRRRE